MYISVSRSSLPTAVPAHVRPAKEDSWRWQEKVWITISALGVNICQVPPPSSTFEYSICVCWNCTLTRVYWGCMLSNVCHGCMPGSMYSGCMLSCVSVYVCLTSLCTVLPVCMPIRHVCWSCMLAHKYARVVCCLTCTCDCMLSCVYQTCLHVYRCTDVCRYI